MRKNDIKLVAIILILAVSYVLTSFLMKSDGDKVVIMVNGAEYKTMDLNEDTTFTIELENGAYNTFTVKDGYVDMIDASCPDGICVNHRDIHYNDETIVCLPNNVVIQIASGEESQVDAVAK